MGFGVLSFGFRVWGLGCRVQEVSFKGKSPGFQNLGFKVLSMGFQGLGFRVWGLGFGV